MSLLTVAQARALVETSVSDEELQCLIDREEEAVAARLGPHYDGAAITETHRPAGGSVYLRRAVESVTSVSERASLSDDAETLDTDEYYVHLEEGRLERLAGSWGAEVTVQYTPEDDSTQRRQALIELVRLALRRTAMQRENVAGEWSYQAPDWNEERARLLRSLGFWEV